MACIVPLPKNKALFFSLKRDANFLTWLSWANASLISPGSFFNPSTISFSCLVSIELWSFPIEQISRARETSWVVKAFVLATPISGPAWVKKVKSDNLVRLDSAELEIQSDLNELFIFLAALSASRVSAVYPLWDIVTKRVLFKRMGRRYRY